MSERIREMISKLQEDPRPAELENLITLVIIEACGQRRQDIAGQLGRIELRTVMNGGTYGPFEDFKSFQELESIKQLTLGLAGLLDVPQTGTKHLSATVTSPIAARRMERYLELYNLGQNEFAIRVGCSEKTLRNFRKTGRVRRVILAEIAQAMHTTPEELLKPE
jgi:hypothetical protein